MLKPVRAQQQAHERDVGGVHRLQREARAAAVEVGVRDQVFHRIQDLLQQAALNQTRFEHRAASLTAARERAAGRAGGGERWGTPRLPVGCLSEGYVRQAA